MLRTVLEDLELHPISIPMRHRFRGVDARESVLIRGPGGWGEFSPFPEYPVSVASRWLESALEAARGSLPEPIRTKIPFNVTVPEVSAGTAHALVKESGASTAKVKIGGSESDPSAEVERLDAVKDALGSGRIRIDVNGKWSVDYATQRLTQLARFDFEYVEQPVATIEEMVELRRRVDVPLAADELVRQQSNPHAVVAAGAADLVVLKVQPMGGVREVLRLASDLPVPVVISSALETSVGMYSGLVAASVLEHLPFACGLGTVALLGADPTSDPLVGFDGFIEVRRPEPNPTLLKRWRPEKERSSAILGKLYAAAQWLSERSPA